MSKPLWSEVDERINILRRICARGRSLFLANEDSIGVDMFEHMENEVNLLANVVSTLENQAAQPAVPEGMVLVPKHYAENVGYAAVMLENSASPVDRLNAPPLRTLVKLLAATPKDQPSRGVVDEVIATLDEIGGLTRALRHGGPAPEDLQGLSDALTEATNMAHEAMHALQAAQPAVPPVNIRCETQEDGLIGTTSLNVIRVELEDDGSLTAVTDHWPQIPAVPSVPEAAKWAKKVREFSWRLDAHEQDIADELVAFLESFAATPAHDQPEGVDGA